MPLVSPYAPGDDQIAEICAAAGYLSMGVAVGMLVAGLIVGYMVGARKELMKMLNKLKKAAEQAADKGGDDDKDEDGMDGDEEAEFDDLLLGFMNRDYLSGLDDHPDTEFNPIMMYQVKKVKDEIRERKELVAKLVARGFEPDHLDTLGPKEKAELLAELKSDTTVVVKGNVGSVAGKVRKYGATQNSTSILVGVGARFMKGKKGGSAQDDALDANVQLKRAQEARDRLRVIDQHLSTTQDIEVGKESNKKSRGQLGATGLLKNALETAKETKDKPYGGDKAKRQEEMATYASRGRTRVGAPLDHAITAKNEKDRRDGCGGRGASVAGKAKDNAEDKGGEGGGGE